MAKRISMTERVTAALHRDITNGVYHSDSLLTENEVSQKFCVSKTPAREALSQLCAEGLLEKIPHKGYLLKRYSLRDVESLLQFRYVLETSGVELVIQLASDEDIAQLRRLCEEHAQLSEEEKVAQYITLNSQFHISLISMARNPFMTAALANTMDQLKLALAIDQAANPQEVQLKDHWEIVEAVEKRDVESAKALVGQFVSSIHGRIPSNQSKWEWL